MPVISGNGRDVITVNGRKVTYQGIGHVRHDMPTDTAVEKTKHNGLDEYYINVKDDAGRTQRIVVYGDQLDFSFRNSKTQPTIMVNGKEARLVAFDQEETSFVRGAMEGAKTGINQALDALAGIANRFMGNIVLASGAAALGSAGLFLLAAKTGLGAGMGAALGAAAGPISMYTLGFGAISLLTIALVGAIKGGVSSLNNKPKMETIATITEESSNLDAQKSQSGGPAPLSPVSPGAVSQQPQPQQPAQPQVTTQPVKPPSQANLQPVKPPAPVQAIKPEPPARNAGFRFQPMK